MISVDLITSLVNLAKALWPKRVKKSAESESSFALLNAGKNIHFENCTSIGHQTFIVNNGAENIRAKNILSIANNKVHKERRQKVLYALVFSLLLLLGIAVRETRLFQSEKMLSLGSGIVKKSEAGCSPAIVINGIPNAKFSDLTYTGCGTFIRAIDSPALEEKDIKGEKNSSSSALIENFDSPFSNIDGVDLEGSGIAVRNERSPHTSIKNIVGK